MRSFARALRGALVGGAVTFYFSACGVPEFGFQDGTGGTDGGAATGGAAGAGGSTGGSAGDSGNDVTTDGDSGPTGCTSNADCAATPTLPVCDIPNSKCVECLPASDNCPKGTYCAGTVCKIGCNDDEDCAGLAPDASAGGDAGDPDAAPADAATTLTCDTSKNLCVGCSADPECPLGTVCDTASGSCIPGCATSATCPSSFECCAKECVNPSSNVDHCGACETPCKPVGGSGKCEAGVCKVDKCDLGLADCNGSASDGCETTPGVDPLHCGACNNACPEPANAAATCVNGNCGTGACKPGFESCDSNPANGCEVNLQTSVGNCGTCNLVCDLLNSNEICKDGACAVGSCVAGFADCDKASANGCEINTLTSSDHCGGCGNKCDFPNGAGTCNSGICTLSSCAAPWKDCDLQAANGCEKNSNTDPQHCGTCGNACSTGQVCQNGSCVLSGCAPPTANCDSNPADCETNTNTSTANCGGCGIACTNAHGSTSCIAAVCTPVCATGWGNCDGDPKNGCETPLNTLENCGACGSYCALPNATPSCDTGQCTVATCLTGFGNCNGLNPDGCEINVNTSVPNCGGCGSACSPNNGTPSCSGGNCSIACNGGYADCNSNPRIDGCEVNLTNNSQNCSACGTTCPPATPNCVGGSCISACPSGFADCDGNAGNGCETNLNTSHNKCGSCSNACGASQYCNNSVCANCSSGTLDCDLNGANGCEANTATNPNACGGCGTKCGSDGTCGCASSACSGGTIYFSEDFSDNAKGWTLQGEWAIGPTSAGTGQQQGFPDPASDHSTTSDNGVAGIVLGGNYANPINGPNYITSPVINLSAASGTVRLTFWRWLNIDWDPFVTDTVEVYNGSSWVVLWTNATSGKVLITDNSWTRHEYDVTAHKNANFRVRFSHKTGKSGNFLAWIMSGWNIDDLSLSSGTCN